MPAMKEGGGPRVVVGVPSRKFQFISSRRVDVEANLHAVAFVTVGSRFVRRFLLLFFFSGDGRGWKAQVISVRDRCEGRLQV